MTIMIVITFDLEIEWRDDSFVISYLLLILVIVLLMFSRATRTRLFDWEEIRNNNNEAQLFLFGQVLCLIILWVFILYKSQGEFSQKERIDIYRVSWKKVTRLSTENGISSSLFNIFPVFFELLIYINMCCFIMSFFLLKS